MISCSTPFPLIDNTVNRSCKRPSGFICIANICIINSHSFQCACPSLQELIMKMYVFYFFLLLLCIFITLYIDNILVKMDSLLEYLYFSRNK